MVLLRKGLHEGKKEELVREEYFHQLLKLIGTVEARVLVNLRHEL